MFSDKKPKNDFELLGITELKLDSEIKLHEVELLKLELEGHHLKEEAIKVQTHFVTKQFHKLSKTKHPDKGGHQEEYKKIQAARDRLIDKIKEGEFLHDTEKLKFPVYSKHRTQQAKKEKPRHSDDFEDFSPPPPQKSIFISKAAEVLQKTKLSLLATLKRFPDEFIEKKVKGLGIGEPKDDMEAVENFESAIKQIMNFYKNLKTSENYPLKSRIHEEFKNLNKFVHENAEFFQEYQTNKDQASTILKELDELANNPLKQFAEKTTASTSYSSTASTAEKFSNKDQKKSASEFAQSFSDTKSADTKTDEFPLPKNVKDWIHAVQIKSNVPPNEEEIFIAGSINGYIRSVTEYYRHGRAIDTAQFLNLLRQDAGKARDSLNEYNKQFIEKPNADGKITCVLIKELLINLDKETFQKAFTKAIQLDSKQIDILYDVFYNSHIGNKYKILPIELPIIPERPFGCWLTETIAEMNKAQNFSKSDHGKDMEDLYKVKDNPIEALKVVCQLWGNICTKKSGRNNWDAFADKVENYVFRHHFTRNLAYILKAAARDPEGQEYLNEIAKDKQFDFINDTFKSSLDRLKNEKHYSYSYLPKYPDLFKLPQPSASHTPKK